MALIKDKATLLQFVRINFINDESSLPDFELAEERYLIPIIGYDLYDVVIDTADSETPAEPTPQDLLDAELLKKCRAVVAPLAYLLDLPNIQVQLTDAGLRTISTDHMQAAHRWEYNEIKESLMDKGAFAIENLLRFLFKEKDSFPEWTGSNEYQEADSLLFKTGEEFRKYFPVHQPYRIFWELRPLIREVEDFYVKSAIGEVFYNELRTKTEGNEDEKRVLDLIKKTVAQTTIVKAIEKLSVTITNRGFTLLLGAGNTDSVNSGDTPATNNGLSLLYESCQRSGDAYLLQLKEYLNKKASADLFATFFSSSLYEAPVTCVVSPNANRKIFGF